jgi:hypothetical protein
VCINSPKLWSGNLTVRLYLDDEAVARCLRCAVRKLAMHDYQQQSILLLSLLWACSKQQTRG